MQSANDCAVFGLSGSGSLVSAVALRQLGWHAMHHVGLGVSVAILLILGLSEALGGRERPVETATRSGVGAGEAPSAAELEASSVPPEDRPVDPEPVATRITSTSLFARGPFLLRDQATTTPGGASLPRSWPRCGTRRSSRGSTPAATPLP